MLKEKRGISLITLVITIIVVIILAAAVIMSLQKRNPIQQASKAKFLNDIATFKEDLELYKQNQYLENNGQFDPDTLYAPVEGLSIYDVIPSLENSSYGKNDFRVEKGQLIYQGTNKDYQDWSKDANIQADKEQIKINIASMQNIPVKAGVDVKYSIKLNSSSNITYNNLDKNILVIDKDGNEISTQPPLTYSEYTGTDTEKTVELTITTTGMSDGEYMIKVKAGAVNNLVKLANDETISSDSFTIDNSAPSDIISYTISPEGYTNTSVTLTLNKAADVAKIMYGEDSSCTNEYVGDITVNGNGTIYVKAIDVAGNEGIVQTIAISNIDKVLPTAAIDASVENDTINATISVIDNGQIDYTKTKYVISQASIAYDTNDIIWNNATLITKSPEKISQKEEPNAYYMQVLAADKAGNMVVMVSDKLIIPKANEPVLAQGMTPIKWNGTTLAKTTPSDTNWYRYTTSAKQWANAQTADGSMWVWIPRYEYQITTLEHQSSTSGGNINIKFIPTSQTIADSGYIIEPAFTFGTTQLAGIWVAKFEATAREGVANSTSGDNVMTKHVKVLPNVQSWRYAYISTMYTACRNMETDSTYGWSTNTSSNRVDTHLMKNVEWGAEAYLAQSSFGKNSEVTINSNSNYYTGDGAYVSNQGESTTGNIYGIYDMSGGSWEYVAVYVNNGNSRLTTYGNSLYTADAKYKDVYTSNGDTQSGNYSLASNHKGDALYETSFSGDGLPNYKQSWYSDYSYMLYSNGPFFVRGGSYLSDMSAGLFGFCNDSGKDQSIYGFRPVLAVSNAF